MPGDFNDTEKELLDYALGTEGQNQEGEGQQQQNDGQQQGGEGEGEGQSQQQQQPNNQQQRQQPDPKAAGGGSAQQAGKGQQAQQPRGRQLTDPETGMPVADGRERRYFTNWKNTEKQAQTLATENNTLKAQIASFQQAFTAGQRHGLDPDELEEAASIVAQYKKDPVKAIEYILTQSRAAGIDLSKLNLGGVDTKAIEQMIEARLAPMLKPIHDQHTTQQASRQAYAEAEDEVNQLIDNDPDAEVHLGTIAKLLEKNPSLGTVTAAWKNLQIFMLRNGLDLSLPLEDQLDKLNGQQQGQQRPSNQQQAPTKPIPNGGRTVVNANGGGAQSATPKDAGSNDSWDTIIESVMKKQGLNPRSFA